jgi:multidrug efflux system membrane fusion protein
VVQREITENVRFTGRFNAINYVEIKPRATGYVVSTPFKEGSYVQKGDLLFAIDPRPYQAKLDDANGQVKLYEAKLKLAKADNLRAKDVGKTPGAISKQDLDKYVAAEEEAAAAVEASKASTEVRNLDLEFCSVISPISGRISKYFVTLGNLVTQDSTQLTTVVSEDPIYCYFDADERTLLKVIRRVQAGKKKNDSADDFPETPVFIGLADEKGFPHQGTLNFTSNLIDSQTGTINLRAIIKNIFKNDKTPLFLHGMFCRVLVPISNPKNAILIADRAIGTDQGLKFVYVMDKDYKLEYRRVTVGDLQPDNLRAIESGLNADEKVVVSGIHLVRPGTIIRPDLIEMPVTQFLDGSLTETKPSK